MDGFGPGVFLGNFLGLSWNGKLLSLLDKICKMQWADFRSVGECRFWVADKCCL